MLQAGRGRHGHDHRPFPHAAQLPEDDGSVRRRDENPRRKVQSVRGHSWERSDEGKSSAGEWVDNLHAGSLEVPVIARGDRQTVKECCSSNEAVLDRHGAAGPTK